VAASSLLSGPLEGDAERAVQANIAAAVSRAAQGVQASPANVDNWANAAGVYEALTSVMPDADIAAIDRYMQALNREPNNPAFMNGIGKLFVFRADASAQVLESPDETARTKAEQDVKTALTNAEEWFTRAITAKMDYAPAHFNLGIVYERQGRTEEAVAKLEQALAANSQDVGVAFQLASLYDRTNQADKALVLLENIVTFAPDYANARWMLAASYERLGRLDDAITQVQAVQAANPNNPEVAARLQALQDAKNGMVTPTDAPAVVPEDITSNPPEANPIQ
jgi:tetratricopeptide (TPR) repeat protein